MYIPEAVKKILQTLQNAGYAAYLVGGCVRDHLLSRSITDYDIASSAAPDEVMHLFTKTIPTGIKHGTVTVIEAGINCEVTTFRTEGQYDGRRPLTVDFTPHIDLDLARRDFTINAIAFDGKTYVDPFSGLEDLQLQIIRSVGNPNDRFQEDGLRILRAVRFAAQLGFSIEKQTEQAIFDHKHMLSCIANERIRDELDKILLSDRPAFGINMLKQLQLLDFVLPEMNLITVEQFMQALDVVEHSQKNRIVRLTALLLFIPNAEIALRRLKYERKTIVAVTTLLRELTVDIRTISEHQIKKWLQSIGIELVYLIIDLQVAMQESGQQTLCEIEKVRKLIDQIYKSNEPIHIKDLAINGNDLIRLGIHEGKVIGMILSTLLELVMDHPNMNHKEQLLNYVNEMYTHEIKAKE